MPGINHHPRRDPVLVQEAARRILRALSTRPSMYAIDLREEVMGGRVDLSHYRGGHEKLSEAGHVVTRALHMSITESGRVELARLMAGKAA